MAEYILREQDFESFFQAPFEAYGPDSPYVSPMKSDLKALVHAPTHPTFAEGELTFFSVLRDGVPVGRLTAQVHKASNARFDTNTSYFGFFECADDLEAARLLLEAAEEFGRSHGCAQISGNFNLTAMQYLGVVTEGFENPPYLDQQYNPPHLPRLLEACGYSASFPMSTCEFEMQGGSADPVMKAKQKALMEASELRLERLSRWKLGSQIEICRNLLNLSFAQNPMFVPLTEEEFGFAAKDLMWVIDPRISVLAYSGDTPVGVLVCIPDLNPFLKSVGSKLGIGAFFKFISYRFSRKRAVIIYYAVHPEYQDRGINGLMIHKLFGALAGAGYETVGGTWIADVNQASVRQVQKMGAKPLHRLHLFSKALASP